MSKRQPTAFPFALLIGALLITACGSTSSSVRTANEGPWIAPSPEFSRQIDQHAARLPYLQQLEDFVTEIHWFIGAGEPAYETLLELAASDDTKVAGTALTALSGSNDARLVPYLTEMPWPDGEGQQRLRYERARCHMKLGDWSHVGELIEGLGDENLYARSLCFKSLREATGETFDYHPQAETEAREASIEQWQVWAEKVDGDELQG